MVDDFEETAENIEDDRSVNLENNDMDKAQSDNEQDTFYIGTTITSKILSKQDNQMVNEFLSQFKEIVVIENLGQTIPNVFFFLFC